MTKFRTIIDQISMLVITLMNYEWYLQEEVPYYMCEVVLLRILHPLALNIYQSSTTMTSGTVAPLIFEKYYFDFYKLNSGADTDCEMNQKIVGMVGNRTPHLQLSRLLL